MTAKELALRQLEAALELARNQNVYEGDVIRITRLVYSKPKDQTNAPRH